MVGLLWMHIYDAKNVLLLVFFITLHQYSIFVSHISEKANKNELWYYDINQVYIMPTKLVRDIEFMHKVSI